MSQSDAFLSMNGKGAAQSLINVMIKPYDKTPFIQLHIVVRC